MMYRIFQRRWVFGRGFDVLECDSLVPAATGRKVAWFRDENVAVAFATVCQRLADEDMAVGSQRPTPDRYSLREWASVAERYNEGWQR